MRVDIHQHLWPEPLLRGLSQRRDEPCLTRRRDGWTLRIDVDRLVHGSDRPVLPPGDLKLGDAVEVAPRVRNPARLLGTA